MTKIEDFSTHLFSTKVDYFQFAIQCFFAGVSTKNTARMSTLKGLSFAIKKSFRLGSIVQLYHTSVTRQQTMKKSWTPKNKENETEAIIVSFIESD